MARIEIRDGPRGRRFRVLIRKKGYAVASRTFRLKTDATYWAQETEAAMRSGRYHHSAAKRKTLGEAIDRYITEVLPLKPKNAKNVAQHLSWWKQKLGHAMLCQLSAPDLAEMRDLLLKEQGHAGKPRSASTTVRYLSSLSIVLSTAAKEWLWVQDNPLKGVKKPKQPRGRVRFLDDDELSRLMKACDEINHPHFTAAVLLSLSCGLRKGELLALTWAHVDLERGFIVIEESKNGERRGIPVRGKALDVLRALSQQRTTSLRVFPAFQRKLWEQARHIARLEDFRWHDLRHCCASYLSMSGASLTDVAEILGHRDVKMSKRYSHLSQHHLEGVLDNMTRSFIG